MSTDIAFFETTPFTILSSVTSQGEEEDLLVYILPSPIVSPEHASVPAQVKPPITQVYTRRQHPPISSPPPAASKSDPVLNDDLLIALRKGKRQCAHPISSFCTYDHLLSRSCSFNASLDSISWSNKVSEALAHPIWRNAMIEEMDALTDNGTWDLVRLPAEKKVIGCHCVFTVKVNLDGSIARLKVRFVAKWYAKTYVVDYSDTFSPIAKKTSVSLFISLAATYNWDLHRIDIRNVFLHGDHRKEVYMEQPPGFVAQGEKWRVCCLQKSLYSSKQSPRAWFGKFSQVVEEFGMQKSKFDHFVFQRNSSSCIIMLVVYMDDIFITRSDSKDISSLKFFLQSQFHTKN